MIGGEDGVYLLEQGMRVKNTLFSPDIAWILSASIRNTWHVKKTIELNCEIMTAPAKVYREWFTLSEEQKQQITQPVPNLQEISEWHPSETTKNIQSIDDFMPALETKTLNIDHPLTQQGIEKFTADWKTIIA